MTEEELKQEAEKSLDKRLGTYAYIRKQDCYTNYVDGYIDGAEPREKRIAELEAQIADLEKENAELKEHHRSVCENLTNTHRNIREQLTKAKEIIRDLLGCLYSVEYDRLSDLEQAEQFLNSEGK